MELRELMDGVDTLVSLPDVFIRVNELLEDPKSNASDIGEVIAHDPSLTARLLKVVNSAYYSFPTPVETVSKAVAVLGLEDLHSLVLATSTVQAFERIPTDLMDMDTFWHRSVFCALAARELAGRLAIRNRERFFVTGLLHDIGKLVLFHQLPDLSARILQQSRDASRSLHELEQELLGFDHAQLGAELMRRWRLPASLWEPVRHQRSPADAGEHSLEAAVLNIAAGLTNRVEPECKTDDADDSGVSEIDPRALEITGLPEEEMQSVAGWANLNCMSALEVINPAATLIF